LGFEQFRGSHVQFAQNNEILSPPFPSHNHQSTQPTIPAQFLLVSGGPTTVAVFATLGKLVCTHSQISRFDFKKSDTFGNLH
jgi:hypothetical protein